MCLWKIHATLHDLFCSVDDKFILSLRCVKYIARHEYKLEIDFCDKEESSYKVAAAKKEPPPEEEEADSILAALAKVMGNQETTHIADVIGDLLLPCSLLSIYSLQRQRIFGGRK